MRDDDTHECPAPRCARRVPHSQLACREHWYEIPKAERDAVWYTYRRFGMGSSEHVDAMMNAIDALQ